MTILAKAEIVNLGAFLTDLKLSREQLEKDWEKFAKKLALDLLVLLVKGTPVDRGVARNAWLVEFDFPPAGAPEIADRSGSQAIRAGTAKILSLKGYRTIWLGNNTAYILALDAGHSRQARQGILDPALAALRR